LFFAARVKILRRIMPQPKRRDAWTLVSLALLEQSFEIERPQVSRKVREIKSESRGFSGPNDFRYV
jgi:hypothetical protein